MTLQPAPLLRRILYRIGQWACQLGYHDWYELEITLRDDVETVEVACTRCTHQETFVYHLKQAHLV